jgi:pilus assembly protein Flp/PilA
MLLYTGYSLSISFIKEALMYYWIERGQGLVEYAMLILLVALILIILVAILGSGIGNMYSNIVTSI